MKPRTDFLVSSGALVLAFVLAACGSDKFSVTRGPTPGGAPPGDLTVSQADVTVTHSWVGRTASTIQVDLGDTGGGGAAWSVTSTAPWISSTPTGGFTPGSVSIVLDPTPLDPGTHSAILFWTATAPPSQVSVAVTLTLTPPTWSSTQGPPGGRMTAFTWLGPATFYAGTDSGGIWSSKDEGADWALSSYPFGVSLVTGMARCAASGGARVFAASFGAGVSSTPDGVVWSAAAGGLPDPRIRALICGGSGATLYAATATGEVFETDDGGTSWSSLGVPTSASVYALAPEGTQAVVAGTTLGLYRYDPVRKGWVKGQGALAGASIASLAADPSNPLHLLAGTNGGGVLASADGGVTWSGPATGTRGVAVLGVAFDASGSGRVFAATAQGALASLDAGTTWGATGPAGAYRSVAGLPLGFILLGGDGQGVVRSTDIGATWQGVAGLEASEVTALLFPSGSTAWASTLGAGLFASADGGGAWTAMPSPGAAILALWSDPMDSTHLIASVDRQGLFESFDAAASWSPMGGVGAASVVALVGDPNDSFRLYAGAEDGGVWRSEDGGFTWSSVAPSLPAPSVLSLAVAPDGTVYAGTLGEGLFRSSNLGGSWSPAGSFITVRAVAVDAAEVVVGSEGGSISVSTDGGNTFVPSAVLGSRVEQLATTSYGFVAATDQGAWTSSDGGAGWRTLGPGLPPPALTCVVEDPAMPGRLLGGTAGAGAAVLQ